MVGIIILYSHFFIFLEKPLKEESVPADFISFPLFNVQSTLF